MERMIHIKDNFTIEGLTDFLVKTYHLKGYSVIVNKIGTSTQLEISKNIYGFSALIGLSESIRVTYSVSSPSTLSLVFSEEKWTDKIIVAVIGAICCAWIPTITAGIGMFNQYNLPNNISENVNVYAISN